MVVDIEAVRQARQGNQDSFAQVYQQIAEDLYRVALYSLGIMRILSIRCKRRISQYITGRNELDIDDFLDLTDDREGVEERSSQKIALLTALEKLTPQERQIIALAVVQGYTVRETAEILNAPQGTVSSKLHRTLKKLRADLEK